jgi:hypothetical protein
LPGQGTSGPGGPGGLPPVPSYLGGASSYNPPLPPGAPGVSTPPPKKGKGLAGLVIAIVAAAVVVGVILFVRSGGDDGGASGPGTFEGEITRDEPIAIFEIDVPLGSVFRASLRPDDDFDAVLAYAVSEGAADVPAIESDFTDFNSEFYSGGDIDEPEELADLVIPQWTDGGVEGDNEQLLDLAVVDGSYRFVVRGYERSRGRFELVVEVEDPPDGRFTEEDFSDEDFFSDLFSDDDFVDFATDFGSDDSFFSAEFGDSSDSTDEAESDAGPSDSSDFSDFSSDFSDFSSDFTDEFSGGFSGSS